MDGSNFTRTLSTLKTDYEERLESLAMCAKETGAAVRGRFLVATLARDNSGSWEILARQDGGEDRSA
jgi:predicted lipoprotein with Yx(FWY)xxD motif